MHFYKSEHNAKGVSSMELNFEEYSVFSKINFLKSVTVWAKYLSAFERAYLVLSENAMDY